MKRLNIRKKWNATLLTVLIILPVSVTSSWGGDVAITNTFSNGTAANADQVNQNFTDVKTEVDDNNARIFINKTASDANKVAVATNSAGVSANLTNLTNNNARITVNKTASDAIACFI